MSDLLGVILRAVTKEFGSQPASVMTPTRGLPADSRARAISMYVYHRAEPAARLTMTDVGRVFGRDRTTVRHAFDNVERWRQNDVGFRKRLGDIEQRIAAIGYPGGVQ